MGTLLVSLLQNLRQASGPDGACGSRPSSSAHIQYYVMLQRPVEIIPVRQVLQLIVGRGPARLLWLLVLPLLLRFLPSRTLRSWTVAALSLSDIRTGPACSTAASPPPA